MGRYSINRFGVAFLVTVLILAITTSLLTSIDSDELSTTDELLSGSNPFEKDTDADGIPDGIEVNEYGTNPAKKDTDNDGLSDKQEINSRTSATNPDTDNDGLNDKQEKKMGTNPTEPDTDSDGLLDGREVDIGSNPHRVDTDNDGLNDSYEYRLDKTLDGKNIDPARKTVLVEVDYDEGNKPDNQTIHTVESVFEDAPVSNYDNTSGIDIVLLVDDKKQLIEELTMEKYKDSASKNLYDRGACGFYHIVIADNVSYYSSVWGVTDRGINGALIKHKDNSRIVAASITHEMGHQLGLMPNDYAGIDSNLVQFDEYPSVMNYNNNRNNGVRTTGLNSGEEGFDDWNHINESIEDNTPPLGSYNGSEQTSRERCL